MKYKIVNSTGMVQNARTYILFGDGNIKQYDGRSHNFVQTHGLKAVLHTGIEDEWVGEDGVEQYFTKNNTQLTQTRESLSQHLLDEKVITQEEYDLLQ